MEVVKNAFTSSNRRRLTWDSCSLASPNQTVYAMLNDDEPAGSVFNVAVA